MLNALQQMDLTEQPDTGFKITDLSSLNWALRKLSALNAQKSEINMLADEEIERIESFRQKELGSLQGSEDFFKSLISEYMHSQRKEDKNFKTVKTPYGSVGFRAQQPKWIYDEKLLVQHLKGSGYEDLIKTEETPKKAELKKIFKVNEGKVYDENGEEVAGITVENMPDKVEVKVE